MTIAKNALKQDVDQSDLCVRSSVCVRMFTEPRASDFCQRASRARTSRTRPRSRRRAAGAERDSEGGDIVHTTPHHTKAPSSAIRALIDLLVALAERRRLVELLRRYVLLPSKAIHHAYLLGRGLGGGGCLHRVWWLSRVRRGRRPSAREEARNHALHRGGALRVLKVRGLTRLQVRRRVESVGQVIG